MKRTIVYVTHDQIEAMTLGTRIVVLNRGVIQQIGTPTEIYDTPANLFVADFMGSPPMNLVPATVTAQKSGTTLALGAQSLAVPNPPVGLKAYSGKTVVFGHTITGMLFGEREKVLLRDHVIGIDTGAYLTGVLSAIEMPSRQIFSVREEGDDENSAKSWLRKTLWS